MDINSAPKGTRVKYVGCFDDAQVKWGNHQDPAGLLHVGEVYTVERTEVHTWHTKVFLEGFPGKSFNSVWFETLEQERGGEHG